MSDAGEFMRMEAWCMSILHRNFDNLEPEKIGKLWAQCEYVMKQKGYKFN